MAKMKKLPGVLSFQRGFVITDGLMHSLLPDGSEVPLHVMRHGIRGTQNANKEADTSAASTAAGAKGRAVSNVQQTDSAKLHRDSTKLVVRFGIRTIDLSSSLFACAPGKGDDMSEIMLFRGELDKFIMRSKDSAIVELCRRYVRNLANGRFLWRNRTIAESIEVQITAGSETRVFNALDIPLHDFDNPSADEEAIAQELAKGFAGESSTAIDVRAVVDFGVAGGVEVFPSQNYLPEKKKGFARSLYYVGEVIGGESESGNTFLGQAAIRDQKIGNAVRSIDTWYKRFGELGIAIPVEPNGANLETQLFLRELTKDSGFKYMLNVGEIDPSSDEGQFLLACIVRGGVYSGSESS